ncbi:g2213 [Coccomyxa elongata]
MAENGTAGVEPKGLYMSLDAIIKEKGPEKKEHYARQRNEGFQSGPHRGRGRRGPDIQGGRGRGRFHAVPQQGWQGPQPGSLPFPPSTQRLVRVDTGAERGAPGSGPVLLLPPEFLAQGGGMPFAQPMGFGQGGFFGQGMFPGPGRQGSLGQSAAAERPKETCFTRVESGEVVVKLRGTEIVRVSAAGDVTLDAGGKRTPEVFKALQGALAPLGIRLSDLGNGNWSLSDGRSLTRFHDGVVLPSKGIASAGRGKVLQAHYKTPGVTSAAAAATAASNAAAAAAGLIPPGPGAAIGAFGGMPQGFPGPANGFSMDGAAGFEGDWQQGGGYANGGAAGRPGSGKTPPSARRLKAQGRYTPY